MIALTGSRRSIALLAALAVAGCTTPLLANDPIVFPSPIAPSAPPSRAPDPVAISLPRDDGPHDRLTEWWYYTGHLRTEAGRRFGFEAVVFRAERGSVPAAWVSHFALTDDLRARFHYAQRSEIGPQVDHSPRDSAGSPTGFDLQIGGLSPVLIAAGAPSVAAPWRLAGTDGTDRIEAALTADEAAAAGASFGLQLDLEAVKPPALHDGDGFVDFGPAGSSYYYSRTRLAATGVLQLDGEQLTVEGIAWFDHQWGDFVSVGGGGWDWFAINLDDGRDLTFSVVRDEDLSPVLEYGSVVDAAGEMRHLDAADFDIDSGTAGLWLSPRTGAAYTLGWTIDALDSLGLSLEVEPVMNEQELDTRSTTGVVYWEGANNVAGLEGHFGDLFTGVTGQAYVEITRYGP